MQEFSEIQNPRHKHVISARQQLCIYGEDKRFRKCS